MDKIKKILNNNAILVIEVSGKDCIWIGSGIGFQKKIGDVPDSRKIERRFIIDESQKLEEVGQLLENISVDYLKVAIDIVELAKSKMENDLSNAVYISLADHIANAINLHKKGIDTGTELSWEVKKLYPREYQIGKKSLEMIKEQTSIELNEMEIGNIALHLINAQTKDFNQTKENSRKIKDILTLIRINNKIELDSESLAYDRFITHLRFFFKRMNNRVNKNVENPLIKEVITRYPESYQTMKLIEEYLNVDLNQDEQVYLCLHIQKLIENN